jgi:lipopolysaccharide export LptBFGC system permease protein LptF
MNSIDRYIIRRFLGNFAILFMLLFLFAVAVDLMLALDRFVGVARTRVGDDAAFVRVLASIIGLVADFQAPRFFQFYAYLHGLVAVGAMGFTLAQMYRHRELVAILAAGVSMQRIAMPFIFATFGLSLLQLVNQEFLLPRVAPLLLRDHGHIGMKSVDDFSVSLTADGAGNLIQAPKFDPRTGILTAPTILERDERGRTRRRITADTARWRDEGGIAGGAEGWALAGGRALVLREQGAPEGGGTRAPGPLDFFPTDLSPEVLIVRRYGEFAGMLSLRQISRMLATPGVADRDTLLRFRYGRFSSVLVTVLVMWMTLPTFLIREPASILVRAMVCAAIGIPAMLGAAIFMVVDLPGISPAVGVFLPVVVLIPIVLAQWTYIRT